MKTWTTLLVLVLFSWKMAAQGYKPASGYVPDSNTAVKVAEAVLAPVYGEKHVEAERPFTATLKDGVWTVTGTFRCPDGKAGPTASCDGGVAEVRISKNDARILYMMHGE
jgi:NTF2 fold immunity protein